MNIYILLDRSGSMMSHWAETIGSINGYVATLTGETNVFMATFDNISYDIIRNSKVNQWSNVTAEEVSPRGGTPLYDSSARMMWRILDDNPDKAIFLVMTDGFENESKHFSQTSVKSITNQLDAKKYETIFLGANFDKVESVASGYSRGLSKTANMTTGNMMNFMSTGLAAATTRYAAGQGLDFTDLERASAEGKTTAGTATSK